MVKIICFGVFIALLTSPVMAENEPGRTIGAEDIPCDLDDDIEKLTECMSGVVDAAIQKSKEITGEIPCDLDDDLEKIVECMSEVVDAAIQKSKEITLGYGVVEHQGKLYINSEPGKVLRISRVDLPGWARESIVTVGASIAVVGPPDSVISGDQHVLFNGRPIARLGDRTAHGGWIEDGSPNIFINGVPAAFKGGMTVDPMIVGAVVPTVGGPIVSDGRNTNTGVDNEGTEPVDTWSMGVRSDGQTKGQRTDESDDGWSSGERVDEVDVCRGPRSEYQSALQNIQRAIYEQDLDALVAAVSLVRPECPGDVEVLTALRNQAISLARAEAKANEANMHSAISNANTRARSNSQAWASALGTIQDVLTETERSQTGTWSTPTSGATSTGMGAGTISTAVAASSTKPSAKSCLADSQMPGGGVGSWKYYVQQVGISGSGIPAFKILQFSSTAGNIPSIPGSTMHGPYSTLDAARASLDRLCPPSQRATDSIRYQ